MVEEALRNGTYVPPILDPSKKLELWEAYIGGGGWQLGSIGHESGKKELDIGTNWRFKYSREWDIYAGYAEPDFYPLLWC